MTTRAKDKAPPPSKGNGASNDITDGKYMRKSDAFHWFAFYFAEHYLNTIHLSGAEHSALVRLMCAYGMRQGPLPDDDAELARICGHKVQQWRAIRSQIEPFFEVTDVWRHLELDRLIARAEEKAEQRRNAANVRWAKERDANALRMQSKSNEIQNQNQRYYPSGVPLGPRAPTDWDRDRARDQDDGIVAGGVA